METGLHVLMFLSAAVQMFEADEPEEQDQEE